jgi:c-di-GMP-binding flagellar brake protein YcgR
MWQGMDHRRFPRVAFPCKITIFKKGAKEKISANTENLGIGGVCVELEEALDRFSFVDLAIFLENGNPAVQCEARVVWVVKSKEHFDTGIEFVNISKQDVARLERIVQECLKKEQTSSKKPKA